jgi:predicted outer membrane repeat protein
MPSGAQVVANYSVIGNRNGFNYSPGAGNLPIGAYLNLQPLADNGGLTQTVALGYGSLAIDAGDPAQGGPGHTDQRGVARPEGAGVDIGAFERSVFFGAVAGAANVTTAGAAAYFFTVTYSDDVAINPASLGSGNVAVNGSLYAGGTAAPAVTFVGADASNPNRVVATYRFTPPGGSWSRAANGTYTISVLPNQVSDANGFFPNQPFATFTVAVPLTIVVANANDSGPGSLRAAITAANADALPADFIVFSNNSANGSTNFFDGAQHSIGLLTALPAITNGVNITGPAPNLLVVQRSAAAVGTFPFFSVNAGNLAVALSGMTVTGGNNGAAAAILNASSTLTLTDVTVSNNTSTANGAGIYMSGAGVLNVVDSRVTNNSTSATGGGIYSGAGGTVNIADSMVAGNTAFMISGVFVNSGSYVSTGGMLTITNSTITGNTTTNSLQTSSGTIEAVGAATLAMITNSSLTDNATDTDGGAVYCATGASLSMTNCTLSGNTAISGGAILCEGAGAVSISNCTLTSNTASGSGGAVDFVTFTGTANVTSSTITGNYAGSPNVFGGVGGGGIAIENNSTGRLNIDNSIVSGNSSLSASKDIFVAATSTVTTTYSAIGSTAGFTYTPGPGGLPVGANLNLQPLANSGGPTQTIAFAVGSPLLNAGDPALAATTDQRGEPRTIGTAPDIGAYEYQPITVSNVEVNDGSAQRSEVRSLTVTFSGPVSFANGNAAAAFQLEHVQDSTNVNNLTATVSTNAAGQTLVTLTFTTVGNAAAEVDPVSADNGGKASLADGRYQLTVLGSAVFDAALGWALDVDGTPGGDYVSPTDTQGGGPGQLKLYRLFGDADGNGIADQLDLGQFRAADNSVLSNAAYVAFLDADNSGTIDQLDLGQFRTRNNSSVFPLTPGPTRTEAPALTLAPVIGPAPVGVPFPVNSPLSIALPAPASATPMVVNLGNGLPPTPLSIAGANRSAPNDGGANGADGGLANTLGGIVDLPDLGMVHRGSNAGVGDPVYLPVVDADNKWAIDPIEIG